MTMPVYAAIIAAIFCFLYIFHRRQCCKYPLLIDYPILGMLTPLFWNLWRIHDYITEVLKRYGGTGEFMGPWFTNMNYMVTIDPINVHHIMSKNFDNYIKGPEFHEMFQAFGDGIFTTDSDAWKYNRSLFHSLFKQRSFQELQEKIVQTKLKTSLLPILDHVQQQGMVVDLQDVFNRFTFDNICSVILGHDPSCLSLDFQEVAVERAFTKSMQCIFYRLIKPKPVWELQKWLQIGQEKKMTEACKTFDKFLYSCIASKREELCMYNENEMAEAHHVDLLTTLMKDKGQVHDDKFLRDTAFNLFIAGRDTIASALTWFFWLVATNPSVEAKILEEIKDNFGANQKKLGNLGIEDVEKLVYLHGAICESLRLFPPIPGEHKEAIKADSLPTGHHINPNMKIFISLYAMGRCENIWGKDCLEYKPERWISVRGGIVYTPSYKFVSFNAGPRTCLGKDLSFIQMKIVAATILYNYHIKVVEGHVTTPSHSIVLLMKHGLKVRITKREI